MLNILYNCVKQQINRQGINLMGKNLRQFFVTCISTTTIISYLLNKTFKRNKDVISF